VHLDAIVIGLGAMGSAAAYHLSRTGVRVLGIDRYDPPHVFGSTHGDTRITRLAVGEGEEYVALVRRSHQLWRDIEAQTGRHLLEQCGGLIMGVEHGHSQHGAANFVQRTIDIAMTNAIPHETLTTDDIRSRFPEFNVVDGTFGYLEPEAGYLLPEECVRAQLELASRHGAELRTNERVLSWHGNGNTVTVTTSTDVHTADTLVLCAGPWIQELLPDYRDLFSIHRQTLLWFDLADVNCFDAYRKLPIHIWVYGSGADEMVYGFPAIDGPAGGVKVAGEQFLTTTAPDDMRRDVDQQEIDRAYEQHVRRNYPGLSRRCVKAAACLYTVTPDFRFILDRHPEHDNVLIASPCSGHGFKHSAAIGEALAQLTVGRTTTVDLSPFSLDRFSRPLEDAGPASPRSTS
jgi:sarcosine oxidase